MIEGISLAKFVFKRPVVSDAESEPSPKPSSYRKSNSRARSMSWSDISAVESETKRAEIKILKKDPVFAGIKDKFIAPEIHGWEVREPYEEFEVIAKSSYIQVQKKRTFNLWKAISCRN